MSSHTHDYPSPGNTQKRVYSKDGCKECKRRKIKCDEGKPFCWQCVRLRKQCVYPRPGERVLRISKKKQREQLLKNPESHQDLLPPPTQQPQAHQQVPPQQQGATPPNTSDLKSESNRSTPNHYRTNPNISLPYYPPPQVPPQQSPPQIPPPHLSQQVYYQAPPVLPQYSQGNILQPIPPHHPSHLTSQPPIPPPPAPPQFHYAHQQVPSFYPPNPNSIVLPLPQASRLANSQQQQQQQQPDSLTNKLPPPQSCGTNCKPPSSSSITSLLNNSNNMKSESSTTAGSMNGNSPQTPQTSTSNHGLSASPHPLDDGMLGLYDHTDLELLTTDLNNMVTKIMFDMNYDDSKRKVPETDESSIKSCESTTKLDNHYSYNLPISVISMKNQANKTYLEAFYNEFSGIILPFPAYDKAHDCYFNPARDIILKSASNQKYILAAVLANGARLRFNKTQNEDDEEAYCLYLSKCLKLLGPAIAEDDKKLTSNIENVLLTVLLLTVGNASNLKQDWRPHLKGAKDLLLKASVNNRKPSKIFIFCKIWFVTIEILASFSSHKGGTLQTDQEIDDLINSGDEYEQQVLKELGIVFDNGFNIMGGYHHDCYNLFGKLMKVLNRTRNGTFNPQDSKEYLKLFADFQRVTEIQFINKEGIFPGLENGVLVEHLQKINPITISWMDVSHQTFTQACMMTILEKCFGETYSSPQIQVLTNSIIQSIAYLSQYSADEEPEYKTPHALMMLQWSVSIAAKNLINENHKDAVSKFFQISAKVGSGGATIALKRIIRIWDKRDGKPVSEDENDSEDLVSY